MVSPRIVPLLPTTEAALNLLELLLDRSYDSILITDSARDQRIIYCNAAFEQLTGYTAAEMIGKSPKLLQGPSTDRDETERLGQCLLERGSFEFMMSWRVDPIIVENKAIAWLAIQREVAMQWQAE
jgi:PAS domain S-box-containing protein